MNDNRFDRNERLLGRDGQTKLLATTVTIIGAGGLGTHVLQQLALLGVGKITLIDHEVLDLSNRNRYVTALGECCVGQLKVDLGAKLIAMINPSVRVKTLAEPFPSAEAIAEIQASDYVFGCVDHDGVRFILNEACVAYEIPLFDLASDVPDPDRYGGRVVAVLDDRGCLYCRGVLDLCEVRRYIDTPESRENEEAVYGVNTELLETTGPSVVSFNGVVASLAVTEFIVAVTGLREPKRHLEYRGHQGVVAVVRDEPPSDDCHYCKSVRGQGDGAGIDRYFRKSV